MAFVAAARDGDLPRVQALLPGVGEEERMEALGAAIHLDRLDVLEFLLAAGLPPDDDLFTESHIGYPLHSAVVHDNPRAVALLLEAGAQPNVFDDFGESPMRCSQSISVARLLLDAGADVNAGTQPPLCEAARFGREAVLRALLAHPGVDVNMIEKHHEQTPLHLAVSKGDLGCVAALLAAGADPCAVNAQGRTPITRTHLCGPYEIGPPHRYRSITLLLGAGARQWEYVPTPCPGLEAALVAVWKTETKEKATQELAQLFQRLQPGVQAKIQAALRALHRGGLPEPLRMAVLEKALE